MFLSHFKRIWLLPILIAVLACSSNSAAPSDGDDDDDDIIIVTSESEPAPIPPVLLIDPIGTNGIVSENTFVLSGQILGDLDIASFSYDLNTAGAIDILDTLDADGFFSITITDLREGENTLTLKTTDVAENKAELELAITYTIITDDDSGEDPDEDDEPSNLWELVSEILSTVYSDWQGLLHIFEAFAGYEDALADFFDFFSTWTGDTASLQAWWNDWANAGITIGIINPIHTSQAEPQDNEWTLQHLNVTVNDIQHLSDTALSLLADPEATFQINDDFTVLTHHQAVLGCDFKWTLKTTSLDGKLGIDANAITGIRFLDNSQIEVKLDLDTAEINAMIKLIGNPDDDCLLFNKNQVRYGWMHAEKLSGTLILNLGFDETTQTLKITSLADGSELKIGSVVGGMQAADKDLQRILDALFKLFRGNEHDNLSAEENVFVFLFGIDCDDDCDPYKTLFNESLNKDDATQTMIVTEINKLLAAPLDLAGSIPVGDSEWTFSATPNDLNTSEDPNRLVSEWSAQIDTGTPQDSCARHFKIPDDFGELSDIATIGDFTVQLSYENIAKSLQGLARTGALCFEQNLTINDFVLAKLDLKPHGTIKITPSTSNAAHLDVEYPFVISLNWGNADESPEYSLQNNKIYGTLLLALRFDAGCDAGLTASVERVELGEMHGTLKINSYTFDADIIEEELRTALDGLTLSALQDSFIMDRVINLDDLPGLAVQMEDEFIANEADISFGLTLVDASACDDNAQQARRNQRIKSGLMHFR